MTKGTSIETGPEHVTHVTQAKKLFESLFLAIETRSDFATTFPLEGDDFYQAVHEKFLREVGLDLSLSLSDERHVDPELVLNLGPLALQRRIATDINGSLAVYELVPTPDYQDPNL